MGRAPCCDKANVKKGPWSPEEDAKLKAYIEQHGTGGNWIALPQKIGLKRCGKSCRLRWLNYLRPNIKHGGFTEEEENIICNLYINIGSRWSIIAAQLPGRTDNDIKNYWNTRLKKKLMAKQRKEQAEMKESESFLVSQAMNQNQIPYWVDQQALGVMPMMHPQPNPDHAQLLIGSHQDHFARLLTKLGGQFYHDGPGPQLVSNGIMSHPYALQLQDQLRDQEPSAHVLASSHWPNTEYDTYQGQGNFPADFEVYLNNLLSLEGTDNYSSGTDYVGNSSTTSTSAGSSSWGDMGSLVNTPGSDFDAYQKGTLQKVAH